MCENVFMCYLNMSPNDLTCYRRVQVFPLAPVVSQPVTRVHPLTGEGGARDDERFLCHDPLQSAAQEWTQRRGRRLLMCLAFHICFASVCASVLKVLTLQMPLLPWVRRGCAHYSVWTASAVQWRTQFWLSANLRVYLRGQRQNILISTLLSCLRDVCCVMDAWDLSPGV